MFQRARIIFKAISLFCTSIIGAGFFVLPYMALKFGFWWSTVYFAIFAFLLSFIYLIFGRVIWLDKSIQSVPEYIGKYLGKKVENFAVFISAVGIVGILLVYIIMGGKFLTALFSPYLENFQLIYYLAFFIIASLFVFLKDKYESKHIINFVILVLSFVVLFAFILAGASLFDFKNLNSHFNFNQIGFPYGIMLFSLWALSTIPEVGKVVSSEKDLKISLISGVLISLFFYVLFMAVILGVCGEATSQDGLSGFASVVGGIIPKIGFVLGIITIFDSFLAFGLDLKRIFLNGARLSKTLAWFFACFLPLFLFLMNFRDFFNIIYIVGAFLFTIEIIIVILAYQKFFNVYFKKGLSVSSRFLLCLFSLIILFQFWFFFLR
jgi:amino acid permease